MNDDKKDQSARNYTKEDLRREIAAGVAELDAGIFRDGATVMREIRDELLDRISVEDTQDDEAA